MSLWELAHRLNGEDPDRWHWRGLSLPVKDSIRMLMNEILHGHLDCLTLSLDKWNPESDAPKEFFIRTHMDDAYACVWGRRYKRSLIKHASIDRWEFHRWCQNSGFPLPAFWYACQWTYPDDDEEAIEEGQRPKAKRDDPDVERERSLRPNQRIKIACQEIARNIWKDHPATTIADMVEQDAIQKFTGAASYDKDTVRDWIKTVAPEAVRNRRGRPKKE